jgi:hypothetical protein
VEASPGDLPAFLAVHVADGALELRRANLASLRRSFSLSLRSHTGNREVLPFASFNEREDRAVFQ